MIHIRHTYGASSQSSPLHNQPSRTLKLLHVTFQQNDHTSSSFPVTPVTLSEHQAHLNWNQNVEQIHMLLKRINITVSILNQQQRQGIFWKKSTRVRIIFMPKQVLVLRGGLMGFKQTLQRTCLLTLKGLPNMWSRAGWLSMGRNAGGCFFNCSW